MGSSPIEHQRPTRKNKKDNGLSGGDNGLHEALLIAGKIEVRARCRLTAHGTRFAKRKNDDISIARGLTASVKPSAELPEISVPFA